MSREIKFRAWDENQKYMAYQGAPDLETIQSFIFHFGEDILMQFTGLKDKNGKEIYEGDILRHNHSNIGLYTVVKYDDECAGFNICYGIVKWGMTSQDIVIIGNIYENPNLIKL